MKCLVPVKRVVDPYVHIRIRENVAVETANVKMSMNPFDEIALEEAVQLKEKGIVTSIMAVSIGNQSVQETLRQALARGADSALLIETQDSFEPLIIAKLLQQCVTQNNIDLVLMGKQAIDDDCNQTGQMLAAMLQWPQATFVSKVTVDKENKSIMATREVDGGLETIQIKIPAVITTDLRLNEPRYISLPNVMQAKRKPLNVQNINEFGNELGAELTRTAPTLETIKVAYPRARSVGIKVQNVAELIEKLKSDKVI